MRIGFLVPALLAAAVTHSAFAQGTAENTPRLAAIPAGSFAMGSTGGGSWEGPVHDVRAPAFEIGAKPVTNAQFRAFRPSHESPGDNRDAAPVTGVNWADATAYCEWLSGRTGRQMTLPPEAWWERAIRGSLPQKKYPWGDEPVPDGSERGNSFGVFAVSYNLWEWTADWYAGDYYGQAPQNDPRGPSEGVYKVLRGGGYRNDPASATVYTRGSARPETRSERVTFRVASSGATAGAPPTTVTSAAQPPPQPPPPTRPAAPPARPAPAAAAGATAAASAQRPGGPVNVTGVTFAAEGGAITVKIGTSGTAKFKAFALHGPERLVVDIVDGSAALRPVNGTVTVGGGGVKTVRYSQFQAQPPIFRAVIDLERPLDYRVEAWASELRVQMQTK